PGDRGADGRGPGRPGAGGWLGRHLHRRDPLLQRAAPRLARDPRRLGRIGARRRQGGAAPGGGDRQQLRPEDSGLLARRRDHDRDRPGLLPGGRAAGPRGGAPRRRIVGSGRLRRRAGGAPPRGGQDDRDAVRGRLGALPEPGHLRRGELMGFATDAIHAGVRPDPSTGAIMTPVYLTSTYAYEGLGRSKGYDYARTINPTRSALEENLRVLEQGCAAYAFASGMAAITTVMALLKSGDHVVVSDNVYGGTYRLFSKVLEGYGLTFSYVDTSRPEAIERAVTPLTRMVYIETPTNPIMIITDIAEVASLCRRKGLIAVVDNTFLTPCLQRPLLLGADIVVHSTTKYLNGHSDSVGGALVMAHDEHAQRIKFVQNSAGAILSPFDSWLVLAGINTLPL